MTDFRGTSQVDVPYFVVKNGIDHKAIFSYANYAKNPIN